MRVRHRNRLSVGISAALVAAIVGHFGAGDVLAQPLDTPGELRNGSFESGISLGLFQTLPPGSGAVDGWTVTRGGVDYIGTLLQAADRARCIDLHSNGPAGGMQQAIATDVGSIYRIDFAMAGNPECGGLDRIKRLRVRASQLLSSEYTFDTTGRSQQNMGWELRSFIFQASAPATTIEIYSTTPPNFCGPTIDAASATLCLGPGVGPASIAVGLGSRATFHVEPAGIGPFEYQWRFNGLSIAIASNPTAMTQTLVVPIVTSEDIGAYSCFIRNSCGGVVSPAANLTVCAADVDGAPGLSVDDVFHYLNAWFAGRQSADVDGVPGLSTQDIFVYLNLFFAGC